MASRKPTDEECEDILLSCRYGELDEVKQFINHFGVEALQTVVDENGNTVLHMICGNGHQGVSYLTISIDTKPSDSCKANT